MKKETMSPKQPNPEWHREYQKAPKKLYGKTAKERMKKE